jgi:hypothetical protein
MFLDSLQDTNIDIFGDGSKVSELVQSIAQSVISVLPRMHSAMRVFVNEGALQLLWTAGDRHLSICINRARRTAVKVSDGTISRTHYCAGESSALSDCVNKGLDLYLTRGNHVLL